MVNGLDPPTRFSRFEKGGSLLTTKKAVSGIMGLVWTKKKLVVVVKRGIRQD